MGCSVSSNMNSDKLVATCETKLSTSKTPQTSRPMRQREKSFMGSDIKKKGSSISYQEYNFMSPAIRTDFCSEIRHVIYRPSGSRKTAKVVFKKRASKEYIQQVVDEYLCLESLDHPNIPKVFEFFQCSNYLILVLDYVHGLDLVEFILKSKKFTEKDAASIMEQLLSAINYCHSVGVWHRNLRVESLAIEHGSSKPILKLCEFEFAAFGHKKYSKISHISVTAPEVLLGKFSDKSDVWSCGVLLYLMLCGSPPFKGHDSQSVIENVKTGKYSLTGDNWGMVSSQAKTFVQKLLVVDPLKRLSADKAIKDPWISTMLQSSEPANIEILKNISKLNYKSKVQQAFYTFIVHRLTTQKEKDDLMATFRALDLNKDGKLSKEELTLAYSKNQDIFGFESVDQLMTNLDTNGSGFIDYSEFVTAAVNRSKVLTKDRISNCFDIFDEDGNGSISVRELKFMFQNDSTIDDNLWTELLKEADLNEDDSADRTRGFAEEDDFLREAIPLQALV